MGYACLDSTASSMWHIVLYGDNDVEIYVGFSPVGPITDVYGSQ